MHTHKQGRDCFPAFFIFVLRMKILLIDDDVTFAHIVASFLKKRGALIDIAHSVKNATELLSKNPYDLFLFDYRLPDGTGLDIMAEAKNKNIHVPVIIMTSFNDVRTAVKAMRSGAFDYITKPVNQEELFMQIEQALKKNTITEAISKTALPDFIEGTSEAAQKLQQQIRLVAPTSMSVIIQGESGTGKEYIARSLHKLSDRKNKPFVAIDCGALSNELASSELFGHVKGAFTGALLNQKGKFEEANGGTLFMDEVGNLSYEVQVKLLRAIQERVIQPIGNNKDIKIDVRIITATNDDLIASVVSGKFREDLYHRLNEFKIQAPPLRKRGDDLKLFVEHFIKESNQLLGKRVKHLSPEVYQIFHKYDWPGNLRELKNVVKRMVLLTENEVAGKQNLPDEMLLTIEHHSSSANEYNLKAIQEAKEKELIEKTLIEVKYNKSKAAKLLNIDRSTLYSKMQKYGIEG